MAKLCITRNVKPYKIDIYPQADGIVPVFAQSLHNDGALGKMMAGNQIIVLTIERDGRIFQKSAIQESSPTELSKRAVKGQPSCTESK
jgi:hypothetical protein